MVRWEPLNQSQYVLGGFTIFFDSAPILVVNEVVHHRGHTLEHLKKKKKKTAACLMARLVTNSSAENKRLSTVHP